MAELKVKEDIPFEGIKQIGDKEDHMIDIYGREFLEKEFTQLIKQGVLLSKDASVTYGIIAATCHRCLNTDKQYFSTFKYNSKTITYCRKCLDFGMISTESKLYRTPARHEISPTSGILNKDFQLSFLQVRASNFCKEILAKRQIGMVWAVCGAGKTEMMFESISEALTTGRRVCWAIPRSDVVIELAPRIKTAFAHATVATLHANSAKKDQYGDIVVTTVHQLIRFYKAFDFLIIDEVDAFPYTFDEMLIRIAKKACKSDATTIYLSATPSKRDQAKIKMGRLQACIIPARFHLFPLDIPKYKWCANFYKQVAKNKIPQAAKNWINRKIQAKRRALLFVPTIDCGLKFQTALKKQLQLDIDFVFSNVPNRASKVARFKEGDGQFLITTMILERGVTIPNIDVAIFSAEHEVYDESALVQISGRVGRSPKWPTGEIMFFHHGITKAMEDAKSQIITMNKLAKKQNLLKD